MFDRKFVVDQTKFSKIIFDESQAQSTGSKIMLEKVVWVTCSKMDAFMEGMV